jgi:hypothetical protein
MDPSVSSNLKEREEIVQLLSSGSTIEENATCLKKSRNETNPEEVIWHVEWIDAARNGWST